MSDVTEEESRELGMWLSRLSRVLANVTGVHDWNIVQNNGEFIALWEMVWIYADVVCY